MSLSDKEKQAALRQRRKELGFIRREFWLTKTEIAKVIKFITELRTCK